MDKLKDNSRLIVAGLVTAGIIALLISNSSSNNNADQTTATTDVTQSQSEDVTESSTDDVEENTSDSEVNETAPEQETTNDVQIGQTPSSGPVVVDKTEETYHATVRKNDNQTVVVRQIIADYLADESISLSAEKRLYAETVLVNALPRREVVHEGETIQLTKSQLDDTLAASNKLTEAELSRWSRYL